MELSEAFDKSLNIIDLIVFIVMVPLSGNQFVLTLALARSLARSLSLSGKTECFIGDLKKTVND